MNQSSFHHTILWDCEKRKKDGGWSVIFVRKEKGVLGGRCWGEKWGVEGGGEGGGEVVKEKCYFVADLRICVMGWMQGYICTCVWRIILWPVYCLIPMSIKGCEWQQINVFLYTYFFVLFTLLSNSLFSAFVHITFMDPITFNSLFYGTQSVCICIIMCIIICICIIIHNKITFLLKTTQ